MEFKIAKAQKPTKKSIMLSSEFDRIRLQNPDMRLVPEEVVQAASSEDSPLHKYFEWDDTVAGHRYRLLQARQLIAAIVQVIPRKEGTTEIRAFVSISTDRSQGYQAIANVLNDEDKQRQMLMDAMTRLRNLQKKYENLQALFPVFQAVDVVGIKNDL